MQDGQGTAWVTEDTITLRGQFATIYGMVPSSGAFRVLEDGRLAGRFTISGDSTSVIEVTLFR